jgi:solute carrier family 35 protein E1
MCLPIIVGGVAFASLKKGDDGSYSLKFDSTALVFGMLANAFAAFKGGENSKLLSDKGVAERYGGVGNQVSNVCAQNNNVFVSVVTHESKFLNL